MLHANDIYRWLMSEQDPNGCDAFDVHVLASVLSLAILDKREGAPLSASLGLTPALMKDTFGVAFPHACAILDTAESEPELTVSEQEAMLRRLLFGSSSGRSRFEARLSAVIARRAQLPHHLWQDLGLRSRRDLSWLMERHFEPLSHKNANDMKWKKFLYRTICCDTNFSLCTAPSCGECSDFDDCFGDESGESLLALSHTTA